MVILCLPLFTIQYRLFSARHIHIGAFFLTNIQRRYIYTYIIRILYICSTHRNFNRERCLRYLAPVCLLPHILCEISYICSDYHRCNAFMLASPLHTYFIFYANTMQIIFTRCSCKITF